jgi:hypothetical protein
MYLIWSPETISTRKELNFFFFIFVKWVLMKVRSKKSTYDSCLYERESNFEDVIVDIMLISREGKYFFSYRSWIVEVIYQMKSWFVGKISWKWQDLFPRIEIPWIQIDVWYSIYSDAQHPHKHLPVAFHLSNRQLISLIIILHCHSIRMILGFWTQGKGRNYLNNSCVEVQIWIDQMFSFDFFEVKKQYR